MNKEKFARELKRVKISSKHAKKAFDWIRGNGEQGYHDVWYYRTSPREKAVWAIIDQQGRRYFGKETAALAYLFACQEADKLKEEPPFDEARESNEFMVNAEWYNYEQILDFEWERYGLDTEEPETEIPQEREKIMEELNLLRQFYQIILYGPPGTGKTYAAKEILAEIFNVHRDNLPELQERGQWDIVQFHPSYNYEDFVRGVQVETKSGQVAYKTINKTFGKMCERADEDSGNDYALIIDEINRANVSAVLGELIYALEYRGEAVKTPYLGDLTIPGNLYIIGTMNTADRTIGQIDYAVRRRFAFVHCPPNVEIIKDGTAQDFFYKVDKIFDGHLSPDFEKDDLRIGHSYFMEKGEKLGYKIIYQVIPILREYVKDGVLQKSAESVIKEVEEDAKKLLAGESNGNDWPAGNGQTGGIKEKGKVYFYWQKNGRREFNGVGRTALGIIKNFIEQNPGMDAAQLQEIFSAVALGNHKRIELNSRIREEDLSGKHKRYFGDSQVNLRSGETVYISNQWGITRNLGDNWLKFKEIMAEYGYDIGQCHIVSFGEGDWRSWKYAYKYNFFSSGGSQAYNTAIKKLEKGDIIFVYLSQESPKKGCIAYGKVVSEAKRIREFMTPKHGLLADCDADGKKYGDRFSGAFEGIDSFSGETVPPDMAVGVEWLPPLIENPVSFSPAPQGGGGGRMEIINLVNWEKLCRIFNLNNGENAK